MINKNINKTNFFLFIVIIISSLFVFFEKKQNRLEITFKLAPIHDKNLHKKIDNSSSNNLLIYMDRLDNFWSVTKRYLGNVELSYESYLKIKDLKNEFGLNRIDVIDSHKSSLVRNSHLIREDLRSTYRKTQYGATPKPFDELNLLNRQLDLEAIKMMENFYLDDQMKIFTITFENN